MLARETPDAPSDAAAQRLADAAPALLEAACGALEWLNWLDQLCTLRGIDIVDALPNGNGGRSALRAAIEAATGKAPPRLPDDRRLREHAADVAEQLTRARRAAVG
jgi:hypothetical protein